MRLMKRATVFMKQYMLRVVLKMVYKVHLEMKAKKKKRMQRMWGRLRI